MSRYLARLVPSQRQVDLLQDIALSLERLKKLNGDDPNALQRVHDWLRHVPTSAIRYVVSGRNHNLIHLDSEDFRLYKKNLRLNKIGEMAMASIDGVPLDENWHMYDPAIGIKGRAIEVSIYFDDEQSAWNVILEVAEKKSIRQVPENKMLKVKVENKDVA